MDYTRYLSQRCPDYSLMAKKPEKTVICAPEEDENGNIVMVEKILESPDYGDWQDWSLASLLKAGINPQSVGHINTAITGSRIDKEIQAQAFVQDVLNNNTNNVTENE